MITRIVKMEFEQEFVEPFKLIFKNVNSQIANFEGCTSVKLLQHDVHKQQFFTISIWETATHLENYRQSDLFRATWAKVKPHFIVKAEAWSLLEH
jgi:heme-degrading monooxygenase HmoA